MGSCKEALQWRTGLRCEQQHVSWFRGHSVSSAVSRQNIILFSEVAGSVVQKDNPTENW